MVAAEVVAAAPTDPIAVGPTWQRGPDGRFILPDLTLGWDVISWCRRNLLQPDGVGAGRPWSFTNEQARFVLWLYAIDEQCRFAYRYAMLRRMKGWGKDPLGAVICAVEFVGPCRPGRIRRDGTVEAVALHTSWVQTAATSKEQTRNTMTLFPSLLSPQCQADYSIEIGKELIYAHHGRCQIQAVTSSPRSLEGARSTFVLKNETQHWLSNNEGHQMALTIARNTAKTGGRVLAISNAHEPGEDSDAEHDWDAWQKIASGQTRATGFMYDSVEAPPATDMADRESLAAGIKAAAGDSVWVPVDRCIEEIYDPRTPPSTGRRFYLNQIVAAEDAWISPQEWDACRDGTRVVLDGEEVCLGLDGSKSDDWTALAACRVSDGYVWRIGLWDPDAHGGEIPLPAVDAEVRRAFARYDVVGFYSDYHPFEPYVDTWEQELAEGLCAKSNERHPIAFDMRGRTREVTVAVEAFHEAVVEKQFTHSIDPAADQHIYNARRRPNQYGTTFAKEHRESDRKVDYAAAAVLARKARQDYLALPPHKRRRQRTGRATFI